MPYIGNPPANRFVTPPEVQRFNGDNSTTEFTLANTIGADQDILVSVDGVIQDTTSYSVNDKTLTFTTAPSSGTNNIFVFTISPLVASINHPATSPLNATSGTFTGTVTAGAVAVDNITIDATEIDSTSALTFDSAGTISLDADSGSINLLDGGVTHAELINSSNDFIIKSSQGDKDIIFKGVDGISLIEAMRIDMSAGGTALIGSTSARATGSKLELTNPANTATVLYMFKNTQVEMTMGFKASTDTNFYIGTGSTNVGTNGVYLTNTGTSWISNSDFRKKKNLVAIENALDKIANCRAMTGHFNHEKDDAKKRPFLIAQDWVTALPEAVDENTVDDDGNENLGLSYEGTIPLLVACIKELREENIDLKARITALENA